MKAAIRSTSKTKGAISPNSIPAQCPINEEITIEIINQQIITAKAEPKRKGWGKAFKQMADNGDDQLVLPDVFADENIEDSDMLCPLN